MLRGITPFRKYFAVGLALAASTLGAGCNANCNNTTAASPCYSTRTAPCAPVTAPCAPAPAPALVSSTIAAPVTVTGNRPVYVTQSAPVIIRETAPEVVYQTTEQAMHAPAAGAVMEKAYIPEGPSSVIYKPVPSRSYADAMQNVDGGETKVIRTSSAGSSVVSSVVTASELAAAGITLPAAPVATGDLLTNAIMPADTSMTAIVHQRETMPPAARRGRAVHRRGMPVESAIPAGTPVYITPGGTPVSAYVPAPASGTYFDGAAPTGYLPVTERRGPENAVVHYATRSICEYDSTRGEDCVWTSGF